jgi:RecA-family ATPase
VSHYGNRFDRVLPQRTEDYLACGAPKGRRNDELYAAACQFRDACYSQDEAKARLTPRAVQDGLPEITAVNTIRSAFNGSPRAPIHFNGTKLLNGTKPETPKFRKLRTEPEPLPVPLSEGAIRYLETSFLSGEFIGMAPLSERKNDKGEFETIPVDPKTGRTSEVIRTREEWVDLFKQKGVHGVFTGIDGVWVRINPFKDRKGGSDKDVAAFRALLIESDLDSKEAQLGAFLRLGLPVATVLDSANKSIHARVTIDAPDEKTYRERVEVVYRYCQESLGLCLDPKNKNPSRYTRLPDARRARRDPETNQRVRDEDTGDYIIDTQSLLAVNLPGKPWEEWVEDLPIDDGLPEIRSLVEIVEENAPKPPEVIKGILYRGLKMVVGGPSKSRKTWILMDLGLSVATGTEWLGFETVKGNVLYVNFELPEPFFRERCQNILKAKGIREIPSNFDELNLRGYAASADQIIPKLIRRALRRNYTLIVLDPTYKMLGDLEENSNGDMTRLLNEFERLAVQVNASVVNAAHFAKGDASAKAANDRIAGAGAFVREPDSVIMLTPNEVEDAFTVDFTLRCLAPQPQVGIKWAEWRFRPDGAIDPRKLKKAGRGAEFTAEHALDVMGDASLADAEWKEQAMERHGMSKATFYRLKKELVDGKRVYLSGLDKKWAKSVREATGN